jgi:DNA-binding response OmpR family regulator
MNPIEIRQTAEIANTLSRYQSSPPHHILVVDDEPMMRAFNTSVLTRTGYLVDAAEDGASAWDRLLANNYDLLITDNAMPKVSGLDLIQKVRAAGMELQVIMVTGELPEKHFVQNPELRPAAVLLKPINLAEFLGTVRAVLRAAVPAGLLLADQQTLLSTGTGEHPSASLRI